MKIKYEVDYAEGEIDVDEEAVREAFAKGGVKAVEALLQENIDTFVNNNVCAVLDGAELKKILEELR